ncbi:MAG TPA: ATP-binding protein, partial [Methanomassiliicoccales archaeon]|nr:ATP-binding protein [Methanomassiliicoccales archaeon]
PNAISPHMAEQDGRFSGALTYGSIALLMTVMVLAVVWNDLLVFVLSTITLATLIWPLARGKPLDGPNRIKFGLMVLTILLMPMFWALRAADLIWLWELVSRLFAGLILGGVGTLVVKAAFRDPRPIGWERRWMIAFLGFSAAVTIGTLWEIGEFLAGTLFVTSMELDDTMLDLTGVLVGSAVASVGLTLYMDGRLDTPAHRLVDHMAEQSPEIFLPLDEVAQAVEEIRKGEGRYLEFKSSLRTNLQTGEQDRRMEHAVMKTVAAFLNSDGGTLYIGVSDDRNILGIDLGKFANNDKFFLHFGNLLKQSLGAECLAKVEPKLIDIDGTVVMRVRCLRSELPVYLNMDNKEQYFIRSGVSTVELIGRDMVQYIQGRFD